MARTKTKNWVNTIFSLDPEVKEKIKEIATYENISKTELVEFLVKNWDSGINPTNKLNNLLLDRKKVTKQLEEIDNQIGIITEQIKLFDTWKKEKNKKKSQAIEILQRKFLNKDFEEVERISKVWQRMTGIPAIELIAEATNKIKESGI